MSGDMVTGELTFEKVKGAAALIAPVIQRTPVLCSEFLDTEAGAALFFKCENFQAVGAFKARGAAHAVARLSDAEAARGVVTHSSGNHGAALAWAARTRGIAAQVVMPRGAARSKVENVERHGGRVIWCEPNIAARERAAAELVAATGAVFIHPYENFDVMAGQGTAALELMEEVPELDVVLCPVGGGGLLAGTAVAVKGGRVATQVIGVEPAVGADAWASWQAGRRVTAVAETMADGLRSQVGAANFAVMQRWVDGIVTVEEAAIARAMRRVWEELKIVIEPSCAVPYAAVAEGAVEVRGKRVGIILTGGNVDLDRLPWQVVEE